MWVACDCACARRSLRWHYPDQVEGSSRSSGPLSLEKPSSPRGLCLAGRQYIRRWKTLPALVHSCTSLGVDFLHHGHSYSTVLPMYGRRYIGRPYVGVPKYQDLMEPTLMALRSLEGWGYHYEIDERVTELMEIPEHIASIPHSSGGQTKLENNLGWARTHLKKQGLIDNPERGLWVLL